MTIRAILFDFDGTLARFGGEWRGWLDLLRSDLGLIHCDLDGFAELLEEQLVRDDPGGVTLHRAVEATLARLEMRPPPDLEGLIDGALRAYAAEVRVMPGARDLLQQVRARGSGLGLVSNGPADMQRAAIEASALESLFGVVLISGDSAVGVRKPDARIFTLACSALGAAPDAVLMVGDSIGADVRGAQAAGLQAVWLNANAAAGTAQRSAEGVPIFRDIGELAPWLLQALEPSGLQ